MAEWRTAAAAQGVSFASYIRSALDEKTASVTATPKPDPEQPSG